MNKTIKTIFLTGYMGAGKTLIGKSLSKKINYNIIKLKETWKNNYKDNKM